MFSEFSATRPTRPPFTFFATDTETKMRRKKKFHHLLCSPKRRVCVEKVFRKKKRKRGNKRKEKATRVVNMLINADSFSSRFKENGRVFKIKKERGEKRRRKRKERSSRMKPVLGPSFITLYHQAP